MGYWEFGARDSSQLALRDLDSLNCLATRKLFIYAIGQHFKAPLPSLSLYYVYTLSKRYQLGFLGFNFRVVTVT